MVVSRLLSSWSWSGSRVLGVGPESSELSVRTMSLFFSARVLVVLLLVRAHLVSGSYPRAQNLTWKSTNFKTFLTWEPRPTPEFTYTLEIYATGENKQRSHHCTRSNHTSCDLSAMMTNIRSCYKADVLSEPPLGATSDLIEFPHSTSERFCPYQDTDIGQPDFELQMNEDKSITTLTVADLPTAVFNGNNQLNIRNIFNNELYYRVTYRKNQSTGKREKNVQTSVIQFLDLDPGESYCFSVQVFIPSRSPDKQLGKMSPPRCSHGDNPPFFKVYSPLVIIGGIALVLLVVAVPVGISVFCCKRRKKTQRNGKEGVPLRPV